MEVRKAMTGLKRLRILATLNSPLSRASLRPSNLITSRPSWANAFTTRTPGMTSARSALIPDQRRHKPR